MSYELNLKYSMNFLKENYTAYTKVTHTEKRQKQSHKGMVMHCAFTSNLLFFLNY